MEIYSKRTEKDGSTRVRIFGITVKRRYFKKGYWVKKYLGGIYKNKRNDEKKIYYILGIKTKEKKFQKPVTGNPNTEAIISAMRKEIGLLRKDIQQRTQAAVTVAIQHQKVFPQFKNIHKGKDAVIIGTAPTLNYYTPIKDAIHIGVNMAYQKLDLDYWFCIDNKGLHGSEEELKNTQFVKFFGQAYETFPYHYYREKRHNTNSLIESCKNAYKYYVDISNFTSINTDIETQMFPDIGGCIFSALYFTLYTGVKRIYIVGCDASATGHFNGTEQVVGKLVLNWPNYWKIFKTFSEIFYPDVEFISINPVGLKGMFKDVYTEAYLEANPNIKEELGEDIHILNGFKSEELLFV